MSAVVQHAAFKNCSAYKEKISSTDGRSLCLFRLGDQNKEGPCQHCLKFTKQARCNCDNKLMTLL